MRRPGTQAVPLHKNWLLVAGIALVVLGFGNWFFGAMRAAPYREYLAEHPGPRGTEQSLKAALLEPPDEQRERRDIAYAKLDFYGLVETGGRGMIVLGGLLAAGGWARRLRPDSPARLRPADGVSA
jgi:hypothetical protein